jgi:hypothetical protein
MIFLLLVVVTGTYCPRDGHWDPFPCPPGSFSGQVGMSACTLCPRGYICPAFGRVGNLLLIYICNFHVLNQLLLIYICKLHWNRVAPATCPPGFVCSNAGLRTPNLRCPAGYFCPNGTSTVDPLRNDTTTRPYPCTPGTYCLTGVGYPDIKVGDFTHAQPCTEGFFCESASYSPRGNGLCPKGFVCALGTAAPKPAQQGYYAELLGTIQPAKCFPGFYAPTLETSTCFECPPGTACEQEGTYKANYCPPGTYRSFLLVDGVPCVACPQGYWSKNYGLREQGECVRCPPGMVCPIEGMVNPCSRSDLPTPYEPVVNYQGAQAFEYQFPDFQMPPSFTILECLRLNDGYETGKMTDFSQNFFYGELIPPYIDELGRGAHFR